MDTFKISIVKYGNFPDYFVYTDRGKELLFSFKRSTVAEDVWYFTIPGMTDEKYFVTTVYTLSDYVLAFSKSVINVRYCLIDFDVQFTVEARRILGKVK